MHANTVTSLRFLIDSPLHSHDLACGGKTATTIPPTEDPNGFSTILFPGQDNLPQRNSTCRPSIPADATGVQQQLIAFDYTTNVLPDSNATLAVNAIALRLQTELTQLYLNCEFEPGSDFYTYAVSSAPSDSVASQACTEDQIVEDNDCYNANGAFVVTIFYLPSTRRNLGETITDVNVLDSYSDALEAIFSSGSLTGARVVSTTYNGITNADVSSRNAGAIAGGVIGGLVGLLLICVAVYLAVKRQRDRDSEDYQEQVGDDNYILSQGETPEVEEREGVDAVAATAIGRGETRGETEIDDDTERLQDKIHVMVVNEEDESLASSVPIRRPQAEAPDDEPQPPRFLSPQELATPRDYSVSDTVDL